MAQDTPPLQPELLQPNTSRTDIGVPTSIPDVTGRSLREAALAYADAGWFVLPIQSGTKHPGSVVGLGWQRLSSRDPEQIAQWWDEDPDRGIALHVGRSGAVAFDLDNARLDELPVDIARGLRSGRVQLSRRDNPDRGHYVFAAEPGAFGNGAGAFRPFGEVRGRGGVIIAAPTPHVKDDGEYRWVQPGPLPPLPDALRACLSTVTEDEAEPLTDEQFEAFLASPEHQRSERTGALSGVLTRFEKDVRGGVSSHEALIDALPWAFREVRVGLYPAEEAVRRIESAFLNSFVWEGRNPDRRARPEPNEFYHAATWAAAQAMRADPAEILARVNRSDADAVVVDEEAGADSADRSQAEADRERRIAQMAEDEEMRLEARKRARRNRAAKDWRLPVTRSGLTAITDPAVEPPHLVEGLVIGEGITLLSAQNKTGKSTVGLNVVKAVLYGEQLFGTLPTHLSEGAGIGIWNAEVSTATFEKWCREHGVLADEQHAARVHFYHCVGDGVDIQVPQWREWAVRWLRENNIQFWVLDPLSKIMPGNEDKAEDVNAFWRALRAIMKEAGCPAAFVIHHAGHVVEGMRARARGSSALEGDPEVILSYEHSGKPGDFAPDDRRYLSGVGRIDVVARLNLDYERTTRTLRVSDSSTGKVGDQEARLDHQVARTAYRLLDEQERQGKPKVLSQVALKRAVSANDRAIEASITRCDARGWLTAEKATTGRKEWRITTGPKPLLTGGTIPLKVVASDV